MKPKSFPIFGFLMVQAGVATAFAASYQCLPNDVIRQWNQTLDGSVDLESVVIERDKPLRITPFYDDPTVVSDKDLAIVLEKVRPKLVQGIKYQPKFRRTRFANLAYRCNVPGSAGHVRCRHGRLSDRPRKVSGILGRRHRAFTT